MDASNLKRRRCGLRLYPGASYAVNAIFLFRWRPIIYGRGYFCASCVYVTSRASMCIKQKCQYGVLNCDSAMVPTTDILV